MPDEHILELTALRAIHPRCAFYESCGTQAHIRLSLDPTPLPAGTIKRPVHVNWVKRPGNRAAVDELREIGWKGLPSDATDLAIRMNRTKNAQVITEWAAIGVFALLIHDLEGAEIQQVLAIGSGGDYLVLSPGRKRSVQAEIRGIRIDATGSTSRSKLGEKKVQVLTKSRVGFASVTTFSHPPGAIVHSYLHYVRKPTRKRSRKAKRK
jgi:hypothetical protein